MMICVIRSSTCQAVHAKIQYAAVAGKTDTGCRFRLLIKTSAFRKHVNPHVTPFQQAQRKSLFMHFQDRRSNGENGVIYRNRIAEKIYVPPDVCSRLKDEILSFIVLPSTMRDVRCSCDVDWNSQLAHDSVKPARRSSWLPNGIRWHQED